MKSKLRVLATLAVMGTGLVPGASAATLNVPAAYPTIQAAIDAAIAGDIVEVEPGLYVQAVSFRGKGITLRSTQGAATTIIQSPSPDVNVVSFVSGEPTNAVLEGFTVRGGNLGVNMANTGPTIRSNIITGNRQGLLSHFSAPLIEGNTIVSNTPRGGLQLQGAVVTAPRIIGNNISHNTDSVAGGAAIKLSGAGTPVIRNNLISSNTAPTVGGGIITMTGFADALVEQNLIIRNNAGVNGTIAWVAPQNVNGARVINNTIAFNDSTVASGINAEGFDTGARIINNIIYAAGSQTAIRVGSASDLNLPLIATNLVVSESGAPYGGIAPDQTGMRGNISGDPAFMDAAANDFRLLPGSPAIDVALASLAPPADFVGLARPVDGNGDGIAAPDLGVYEFSGINHAPVADAKTLAVQEGGSGSVQLSGSDEDGDALTFRIASEPAHGTLTVDEENVLYTPAPDYSGADSFTYVANDGTDDSEPATVSITVTAANEAPIATGAAYTTPENTARAIFLVAHDPDNDPLTWVIAVPPQHGTLSGTAPNLVYTPAANFHGSDSFEFFVRDAELASANATVSITVTPVNDPPTAESIALELDEDTQAAVTLTGSDPDGDALTFIIVTPPAHGTLLGGAGANLTYQPTKNFHGNDFFTYRASDGSTQSDVATVALIVRPVNDAPVALNQTVSVLEDHTGAITVSGTDVDGDPLTFSLKEAPAHGTVTGTAPNFTYTPAPNFHGKDSFRFYVHDGQSTSHGTIIIVVEAVNDVPVAEPKSLTILEDHPAEITLTAGDVDGDPLSYSIVNGPGNGTLSGVAPNLVYTPAANFYGSDSFTFRASDQKSSSEPVTVTITVIPVNDPPTFTLAGSIVTAKKNAGLETHIGFLQNLSAGPSEAQNVSLILSNSNPDLFLTQPSISASGTLTFDPRQGRIGTAVITVKALDNGGTENGGVDRSSQTFSIVVDTQLGSTINLTRKAPRR